MITIRLNNLSFSYPAKPILAGVNCEFQDNTVYGIIGPNGSGKTTLLKLILAELSPDCGIILHEHTGEPAYLAQEVDLDPTLTALEVVIQGASKIHHLESQLAEIEKKFFDPTVMIDEKRLSRLIEEQTHLTNAYLQAGGPGLNGQVLSLLRNLGFREEEINLPVEKLSGGEKKLLCLARILIAKPAILLLDEPDNHLDLDAKLLLEKIIRTFNGTVLLVSHDRYFLDMVVDEIVEIDRQELTLFSGTYSEYIFEKQLKRARQAQLFQAQQHEISRLEMAAKRLLTWGKIYDNPKFSKRGKAILKRLEHVERIERVEAEGQALDINLGGWAGSRKVLEVSHVCKGFPDPSGTGWVELLEDINLYLGFGERVGLIGPNGSGKTILTKMILGQVQPEHGSIDIGPSVRIGYYAQEFETLDPQLTLLQTIAKAGNFNEIRAVAFMRKFGYDYQQHDTQVGTLSGGERARLQVALITLTGANFLLLDEPTNHLDIPSCEILEQALLDFKGTILTISHDRYFLDRIVTRIAILGESGISNYPGNFSEYQAQEKTPLKKSLLTQKIVR